MQVCEDGEELEVVGSDDCCPTATCVCKTEMCETKPTCDKPGFVVSLIEEGRCCSTYECVCDRNCCPSTTVPTCENGEIAVVTNPEECCPTYECRCDSSQCQPCVTECAEGYKLVTTSPEGACCEVTECQCDVSQCPSQETPSCPSLPGYRYCLKIVLTILKENRGGIKQRFLRKITLLKLFTNFFRWYVML